MGTWEIERHRLRLTALKDTDGKDLMASVFGGASPPIIANWYSGKLHFSQSRMFYGYFGEEDEVLTVEVEKGAVGPVQVILGADVKRDDSEELAFLPPASSTAIQSEFRLDYSIPPEMSFEELKSLGDHFYKAKKWDQAVKAYAEAEEADPVAAEEDDDFCFNRGFALIALNRWDDAQDAFEKCTAVAPDNAAAWSNLGLCHRNLEDWESGLQAYQTATSADPSIVNAWKGLAICAEKLNNHSQRIEACEELIELLPDEVID